MGRKHLHVAFLSVSNMDLGDLPLDRTVDGSGLQEGKEVLGAFGRRAAPRTDGIANILQNIKAVLGLFDPPLTYIESVGFVNEIRIAASHFRHP